MLSHLLIRTGPHLAVESQKLPPSVVLSKIWISVSGLTTVAFLLVESVKKLCIARKGRL